jgi:hypothetical protein
VATAAAGNRHARAADAAAEAAAAADDACTSHAVEESAVQKVVDNSGKQANQHNTTQQHQEEEEEEEDRNAVISRFYTNEMSAAWSDSACCEANCELVILTTVFCASSRFFVSGWTGSHPCFSTRNLVIFGALRWCEKRHLFLSFPYVCPEPVLAK